MNDPERQGMEQERWRYRNIVLAAPHRLPFLIGGIQAVVVGSAWIAEVGARCGALLDDAALFWPKLLPSVWSLTPAHSASAVSFRGWPGGLFGTPAAVAAALSFGFHGWLLRPRADGQPR